MTLKEAIDEAVSAERLGAVERTTYWRTMGATAGAVHEVTRRSTRMATEGATTGAARMVTWRVTVEAAP